MRPWKGAIRIGATGFTDPAGQLLLVQPGALLVRERMDEGQYGNTIEIRPTDRPDASGISSAKAMRMLGWRPRRSWRDYLDAQGRLKPEVAKR